MKIFNLNMLLNHKTVISCLLFLISMVSFSQKKQADKLFLNAQYFRAIPKYEKAIKTTNVKSKQESLLKLADCYRIMGNYKRSEDCYKEAISLGNVTPEVYYNFGNILKNNNNYSEALNNYYLYLEEKPTDKKAENAIKSCKEIKYWLSKPQEYKVTALDKINTKRSEFCPVVLKEKFIYIGEKQNDYIEYKTSDINGAPYLNVFYSKIKNNEFGKTKQLSKKVNTNYHDGPVSFSSDGKTMFLTRVGNINNKRNKDFVNRAKIYLLKSENKSWGSLKSFQYNSDNYSCAHASISNDGSVLFFASDMPGGYGGKDIWMCKKNGDSWEKPVNLGFDVNTSGDEMFPFIRKDGVLFYSSDGLSGFGGLDIISAKQKEGKWLLNRNEGLLLNSNKDDFGIYFVNDSTGYFSSNRDGGKGQDDIYSFIYVNKYIVVDGTVLLTENTKDPAKDVKVYLLDEKSNILDSTRTNEKGYFAFKNLDSEKSYMAEVEETDANLKNKSRYYLADKNNMIARVTHNQKDGGKFVFKNLPTDVNGLPDLYNVDDLSFAGNLLYGENPSKPIANKKVIIKNDAGDVLEETTTNEFGAFAFRNLPLDQNYSIFIEDDELLANSKIILTNKSGKDVKIVRSDSKGRFKFDLLNTDKSTMTDLKVDDVELIMTLNGYLYDQDKKALTNAIVEILKNSEVVENFKTDANGKFKFKNLGADKNYLFNIDETDPRFTSITKIYIADSKGRIYREIKRNSNGKFQFNVLELDRTALGEYSVNDPWLEVLAMKNKQKQEAITIVENLTYAYGDYKIDAAGYNVLDKVITVLNSNNNLKIELSSHTDSRSTDSYNLQLSQKRAKAAVDYLISKGINKNRLIAIGYGETKLLNKCNNETMCTEEEHAVNRRTEFKIIDDTKL
jgi:outer membrane protein OmpA-like peptidoglycan-associated protein/tetratricopeptide (TPR) repeat protein